jgi:hypothetical protein
MAKYSTNADTTDANGRINLRELTVKVDVDVSDALTGLKAIQREAKKATQALRELAETQRAVIADE